MASIDLDGVSKVFPNGVTAVHHLNLRVAGGELLVIVGPSGCGKTTVLRLIAGLERPTEGSICLDGQRVNDWSPRRRNLALVADHGILFPQHSVRENLAWSLRARRGGRRWWLGGGAAKGLAETEINRRVEQVAERLGVTPFLGRRPEELSAGQQQRVALGRALLVEPRVFLLDEPLARLDGVLRVSLARELKQWLAQSGTTSVYVTHDWREAMLIADRVAVLHDGCLRQVASPRDIYARPVDRVVAEFGGEGRMGWLSGRWQRREGRIHFSARGMDDALIGVVPEGFAVGNQPSRDVVAGLRPETVRVAPLPDGASEVGGRELGGVGGSESGAALGIARGTIRLVEDQGPTRCAWVALERLGGGDAEATGREQTEEPVMLIGYLDPRCPGKPGDRVGVEWRWADALWFDTGSGRNLSL